MLTPALRQNEFYSDYDDLEAHFRSEHHLCEDEECLAKKFVVFNLAIELEQHHNQTHLGNVPRARRQVRVTARPRVSSSVSSARPCVPIHVRMCAPDTRCVPAGAHTVLARSSLHTGGTRRQVHVPVNITFSAPREEPPRG